jgi:hypothetical protein
MRVKPLVVALACITLPALALATTANNQQQTVKASSATLAKHPTVQSCKLKKTAKTKPAALQLEDSNSVEGIKKQNNYVALQFAEMNQAGGVPKGPWNWYKHVQLSGLINVTASHWSKPNFGVGTHDTTASSYLSLAMANLNLDAEFGSWVTVHIGTIYMNGSSPTIRNYRPSKNANRRLNLEEAYGTIANFNKEPYYLRAGEQFLPFGHYHRYPITQTLTQVLTQTDLPAIQLGLISKKGFYAAAYIASGENKLGDSRSTKLSDYGFTAGYQNYHHAVGFDFGFGYLRNMADVDSIRDVVQKNKGYTRSVGGLSVYGDLFAGPFGFSARYVTALRRFAAADYQYTHNSVTKGAKPSAASLSTDYNFKTFGHNSRITLGYQWTHEAHNTATIIEPDNVTAMPKSRWLIGYGMNIVRNVALGLQFYQDQDYGTQYGGTNKKNNVVTARVSFLF